MSLIITLKLPTYLASAGLESRVPSPPTQLQSIPFIFFNLFIYLFLSLLRLHCCMQDFSNCSGEQGLLFLVGWGFLIVVTFLLGLVAQVLGTQASVVVELLLNWTSVLCSSRWVLNHWTTREVPIQFLLDSFSPKIPMPILFFPSLV